MIQIAQKKLKHICSLLDSQVLDIHMIQISIAAWMDLKHIYL